MTWDALAALAVVAGAVAVLVWQMRREKRVCAKCEVVDGAKRVQAAGVVRKTANSLRIAAKKS